MSQYLSTEDGEQAQIATNVGWSEFCEWVGALSIDDFPSLHHLSIFGYDNDPADVASEIRDALRVSSPSNDVRSTCCAIINFSDENAKADILIVGCGICE